MHGVASDRKITWHREKVLAYLRGEPIYPATLELDLTSECTRRCPDCPSSRSRFHHHLQPAFIEQLLRALEGHTRGLLLTGGEPTVSPLFPRALELARTCGFENIAVVTNGSRLGEASVREALLAHASTIRLSLYDWHESGCAGARPALQAIEELRAWIDRRQSALQIGVSALTSSERLPRLSELAAAVRSAGAHWLYFHPLCRGWHDGRLRRLGQAGVLEALAECRRRQPPGFRVFVSPERYADRPLCFSAYHAAHFLLVVGADGLNYLGAEVKYQPQFVVADVAGAWSPGFLHRRERHGRIAAVRSAGYSALSSRHRGVLYNDLLERIQQGKEPLDGPAGPAGEAEVWFPHIL